MKQIFLFIFLIGFTTFTFAQVEFSNKFKGIPPANIKPKVKKEIPPADPNVPIIIPPNVYKNPNIQSPPNPVSDYKIDTKSEISMIKKEDEFINPGDEVRDRLNKMIGKSLVNSGLKENDSYIRKTDIDFGVIHTTSPYLIIKIRDYGAIDGDYIDVTLTHDYKSDNIAKDIFLNGDFTDIKVNLKEGLSLLDIIALNRGKLGGNTGAFLIYDNTGKILVNNAWDNLDAGVKSRFKIIKEQPKN